MSGIACAQHTRYTLIKSITGKNVGLAFILRGVDIKPKDLFTVGEDLVGGGGDDAKDLLLEEIEGDLSHIFDEGGVSTVSRVTDISKQASLNTNLHHEASATVTVTQSASYCYDILAAKVSKNCFLGN